MSRSRLVRWLLIAGFFVLLVGGTGGALCKFALNCGLHTTSASERLENLANESKGIRAKLPAGFTDHTVATGLDLPTDFAFLPDGRILVAQKNGLVRLVKGGNVVAQPFIDLRSVVGTEFYRGLIAVQADPDYATNGYVYLLYVQKPTGAAKGTTTMRLTRVTARGDTASVRTEKILLGTASPKSCQDVSATSDCLPSDVDHDGGDIQFADDGAMFVSTGDGGGHDEDVEPTALDAQNLDFLGGKILRITRDGKGFPSNPFWNGDADANRSKVWAYGLRNPFRFGLQPGSDIPYVGDVGAHEYEEIDVATRGANLGWPCYEGPARSPVYKTTSLCKALYARGESAVSPPAFAYKHSGAESVTGGTFVTGRRLPQRYEGAYIFGDWVRGWLKILRFDESGRRVSVPKPFAMNAAGPVAMEMRADGSLYYLALNAGELHRIRGPS
jgi:glucose/arabinose dehydrogenase